MSKKTISTIIQLIVFLSLGIGLMVWRYQHMSVEDKAHMFEAFKHVRWWWSGPVLIIGFLSHYFRALRWKLLLKPLGIFPKTTNVTFAVLIGYLANTLVPRLGEVAKCTVLAKYEHVPADKMIGTIIAERAFDMICLILLLALTLAIQYDVISPFARELYEKLFLDHAGNFVWTRILIAMLLLGAGIAIFYKLAVSLRASKVGKVINNIFEGLKTIGKIKEKGPFLLLSALIWAMYIFSAIIGFWAMPEMEDTVLLAGLSVITFGSVGMIATPGGIGVYPIIIAQVLILYGIGEGIGTAYGWITWSATTAVVLILGIASLILLPIYNRKKT